MILRRRCPSATLPLDHTPAPSGPRGDIASAMAATAVTSGVWPSSRTSPVAPHTHSTLPGSRAGVVAVCDRLRNAFQFFAGFVDLLDRPGEPLLDRRMPVDPQQQQHAADQQRRVVHVLPLKAVTPWHAA